MIRQAFNRNKMRTGQLADGHYAGVDRSEMDFVIELFADHNATGAAVTGRAALLRAGQPAGAQVLQDSFIGWFIHLDRLAVNR